VKPVANRPQNNPAIEAEDITEFRSSAPGLPVYKLGGGLMKECVNLEIKNGRLRSRDKMKMYHDNSNMPKFESGPTGQKFITIPYKGRDRVYCISWASVPNGVLNEIFYFNTITWIRIYRRYGGGYSNLDIFNAFRLNNLFNTNLWVLSLAVGHSLVLVNDSTPRIRNLGLENTITMHGEIYSEQACRAFGFDLIEKQGDIPIRSSGVNTKLYMDGFAKAVITINIGTPPSEATHIRLWLSDKIRVDNDEDEDKGGSSADPTALYPMMEFDLEYWKSASAGTILAKDAQGRNNFYFFVQKTGSSDYRIVFDERGERMEPSFMGIEASTIETMNLVPMLNAQCVFNGIMFGISAGIGGDPGGGEEIVYSSNPGTIFQEQTTALKILRADVGSKLKFVPLNTSVLVFGSSGIARAASLGDGDFSVSKLASLDLSGMRVMALPGIGACCVGKGRFIFVHENTLEVSKELMGLPIADMLSDLVNDIRAASVANNKLYIIASNGGSDARNNRLFCIDLDNGAIAEIVIRDGTKDVYPMDLFTSDNSTILITCVDYSYGDPFVLSAQSGDFYENNMTYKVSLCESSAYGFVKHLSAQVLARLGKCKSLIAYLNGGGTGEYPEGEYPLQFEKLKANANKYQDYFIAATKHNTAKSVEVMLEFKSDGDGGGDNDGLDILSVKLTRERQNEVSSPSFNSGGG